ncbi:LppA family lipoprotein [Streptomyces zaomyceticus]|uniref:LppA family lipoprotein n=1 Tax=Streptomyces zaomyceticus TaxID=68286 RepID=UPI003425847D
MKSLRLMAIAPLIAVAAGCGGLGKPNGSGEEKRVVSRISMQEAAEKADAIMLGSISSVRPELNWVHHAWSDGGCDGHTIDGRPTGSVTRRAAVMTIVSEARRGSLLGVVERHWEKLGYEITGHNTSEDVPAVHARTPEDFRMSVLVGKKGQFFLTVTTPCYLASEVQAPRTRAGGTAFEGSVVPDPSVPSEFWSLDVPVPATSAAS